MRSAMSTIVELDEQGAIRLPEDVIAALQPRARFVVERQGVTLILHPVGRRFGVDTSPSDRVAAVRMWAALERPAAPALANEVLSRDYIYD